MQPHPAAAPVWSSQKNPTVPSPLSALPGDAQQTCSPVRGRDRGQESHRTFASAVLPSSGSSTPHSPWVDVVVASIPSEEEETEA
ncbi:hypothetical protein M427DRAFT_50480 [Gonapodya prolifera JEL478]|uniref:Uncharacterized protein n=1 Tax=Gonapodya prolifera (strain JEL478) TaxID=1344416 RepID=A0A139AZH7_GONPJ|nr:hypothetical protein M427DRAFT_50480 [Gonapodya prolifera JEL478]|eukprot:KXS22119.1 hypothetical protein M427DRAFT_50480 [Gonapodya prolifera JEL478]